MSDAETAHTTAAEAHDDHGSGHGHETASEPLGPIDFTAWAYAIVGGAVGVVVALALLIARGV